MQNNWCWNSDEGQTYCISQIEASTSPPPGNLPGIYNIIVQISPYPGQNVVQMPTLGSIQVIINSKEK